MTSKRNTSYHNRFVVLFVVVTTFANISFANWQRSDHVYRCGLDLPLGDISRFESSLTWLDARPDSNSEEMFKYDWTIKDDTKKNNCFRFGTSRKGINAYTYLLEEPDIFENEERLHRIVNEIEDRVEAAHLKFKLTYNLKNVYWNMNNDYTVFSPRNYAAYKFYILNELNSLADVYELFHYYQPALANRADAICERIIHGLDVMQHTVNAWKEVSTYAFVHGVIIKGFKMILKFWYEKLAIAVIVLYSMFKFVEALRIHREERGKSIADPRRLCEYMNYNYTDRFMAWFKEAEAIDTALQMNAT